MTPMRLYRAFENLLLYPHQPWFNQDNRVDGRGAILKGGVGPELAPRKCHPIYRLSFELTYQSTNVEEDYQTQIRSQ